MRFRLVPPRPDRIATDPNAMAMVRRHPLICFFLLAYALTWGVDYLRLVLPGAALGILLTPLVPSELATAPFNLYAILGNYGPALAGVAIAGACYGRPGISGWRARWTRWRVGWKWYLIALLCAPALCLCQNLMNRPTELLALPGHSTRIVLDQLITLPLSLVLYSIVNAGEEGGWRGFALPHLQGRYGPLWGSCILGVLWEAWHLPSILQPGNPYYDLGALAVGLHLIRGILIWTLYAILGTWIFNNTRGSLLPVTLWHASNNVTADMERHLYHATGQSLPGRALGDWILWPIVAIVIIWLTHGRLGYRADEDELTQPGEARPDEGGLQQG